MSAGSRAVPFLVLVLLAFPSSAQLSLNAIALSGDPAPGAGGASFEALEIPKISEAGHVFFAATLAHEGSVSAANDSGIWGPDAAGQLSVSAREGDPAPGAPAGAVFAVDSFPTNYSVGGDRGLAFEALLEVGQGGVSGGDDHGIWAPDAGFATDLVAREGSAAPGAPAGALFSDFGRPTLNSLEQVAFTGRLAIGPGGVGSADDYGLWGPSPSGGLIRRHVEGEPVSVVGAPGATLFDEAFLQQVNLNRAGQIGYGLSALDYCGLVSATDGSLIGFPAPPLTPGQAVTLVLFCGRDLDGLGRLSAYTSEYDAIGPVYPLETLHRSNDLGLFEAIVQAANPFEMLDEWRFSEDGSHGVMVVTFYVSPLDAVWNFQLNGVTILSTGDPIPGAQPPDAIVSFEGFALSESGDALIVASESTVLAPSSAGTRLLLWDSADNSLHLMVSVGDSIEVSPGDFRSVENIQAGDQSLNSRQQAAFRLEFADGSHGIFRLDADPIDPTGLPVPSLSGRGVVLLSVSILLVALAVLRPRGAVRR